VEVVPATSRKSELPSLITGPLTASLTELKKESRCRFDPSQNVHVNGRVDEGMPRRKELLIDEATGDVVERRLYRADDPLLRGEVLWAKCADLQESDYAVPAGAKRMGLPVIADTR